MWYTVQHMVAHTLEGNRLIPQLPSSKFIVNSAPQIHDWIQFDYTLEFTCAHFETLIIVQGKYLRRPRETLSVYS